MDPGHLWASAAADALLRHVAWSRFGAPPDAIAWVALLAAFLIAVTFPRFVASEPARRRAIALAAVVAGALSSGYVAAFLRGGPRIVDATTYLLQGRAMARGMFAWQPGEPSASVAGRFLVRDALGDGSHVAGIFPPGYPAYLALFVKLGAPMASGPVLAVLLVLATAWLAGEVAHRLRAGPSSPQEHAQLSLLPVAVAWISAGCAALRYHTADTMSHGLAALAAAVALAATLRAAREPRVVVRLVLGAALGALFATRPVSAAAIALICIAVLAVDRVRAGGTIARAVGLAAVVAIGAVPGVALLLLHQHAATGAWLASSQSLYYALSDGPEGCFRYGFGSGIGCANEHGTFVAANLPNGYGAYAAAATSLRRLKAHLVDPLSSEPAFLLVIAGGVAALRGPRALRLLALAPVVLLLAYAPFYFDGNYPGGGARLLADTLPVEHVLAVVGVFAIARHFTLSRLTSPPRVAGFAIALVLAGFALRASYDHRLLRDREGGRPLFEPSVLAAAGVERGLVYVDTDHGFSIGHDPAARAAEGVEVIRRRGDALDRIAWTARGRPPSFHYSLSTLADTEVATPQIAPFEPPATGRIEGEHLWPPAWQDGAYALPRSAGGTCASSGAWLSFVVPEGSGTVELNLPRSLEGVRIVPRVARAQGVTIDVEVVRGAVWAEPESGPPTSAAQPAREAWRCVDLHPITLSQGDDGPPRLRVRVVSDRAPASQREPVAALDALVLVGASY